MLNNITSPSDTFHVSRLPQREIKDVISFRYLRWSFHSLVVFIVLDAVFPSSGISVQKSIIVIFLWLSVLLLVMQLLGSQRVVSWPLRGFTTVLVWLLFIWCIVTIMRGLEMNSSQLITLLTHPGVGGLVWLLPFAILIGRQQGCLDALLPVLGFHAKIGIILVLFVIFDGLVLKNQRSYLDAWSQVGPLLIYGSPFVLLAKAGSNRNLQLHGFAQFIAGVGHFVLSNRAGAAAAFSILLIWLALGRARTIQLSVLKVFVFCSISIVPLYMVGELVLSKLSQIWFIDTRTFLWEELSADFSGLDWIFGRGALGTYYSRYFDLIRLQGFNADSANRSVVEIGYLHLVLKAGLIGTLLYIFVIIGAIVRVRHLKNQRLKLGIALIFLIHLVELLVVGQANFLPSRVFFWILVGYALSAPHLPLKGFK